MKTHVCRFEKMPVRLELKLLDSSIRAMVWRWRWYAMKLRGEKRVREKDIQQCKFCGKYAFECPYCQMRTVVNDLPVRTQCPRCGNHYYVRLWTNI